MRAGWVVIAALCACDRAFGIDPTHLPPPDVLPTTCPAIGTLPRFSGSFHQVFAQDCADYSPNVATATALATCVGPTLARIFVGPIDQPMVLATMPPVAAGAILSSPRIVPEGDVAYVLNSVDSTSTAIFGMYQRVDATTWSALGDSGLPHDSVATSTIGTPTRAPQRHVMYVRGSDASLHELVETSPLTWQEAATTGRLAPASYVIANLTADGLRMIVITNGSATTTRVSYADRASIDAAFSPATPLANLPDTLHSAVLLDDCTRLYFTGLERVFYEEQI